MPDFQDSIDKQTSAASPINLKRILSRVIRFWYLILMSVLVFLTAAFVVNRYSTRIYPIKASIIIKENEENASAKFLYNNELVNPYRNHLNEIYIMKSYPLLQEVLESLNFTVSYYREGDIKTTEFYDPDFPIKIELLNSPRGITTSLYLTINSEHDYTINYNNIEEQESKEFSSLPYNDTVRVNGYQMIVHKKGDLSKYLSTTYLVTFRDALQLARMYSNRLKITWAELGSSVVDLEIQGPVPQKEIDFLKKFIERYQIYDIEKKNTASKMAMSFLDEQLMITGDSLKLYEDQVESFKKRNITINLQSETDRLYQKLLALEDQKFQHRLLENYYQYVIDLLMKDQYEGIFTPASVGITDNVVAELIKMLIDEQAQVNFYKINSSKEAEKHQENPALQSKLQKIELLKQNILKTIDNSRKTQSINLRFINDQIRMQEAHLKKLPATERELIAIQRNYSLKETLYVFLLQKRAEAGLSEASTTSDIIVVNQPISGGAITPKVSQNYSVAFFLGLLIPIGFFALAELLNNKIQSRDDIEQFTSVPVIGGIGHNPEMEPLVVVARPRSAMAEAFRSLRSNLGYFTSNKDHQIFMVTSSIPSEGKSFTTLNLASVLAMAGKKTLIVGADLRKPKLFEELQLLNDKGLSQYLSSMATIEEIIQPSSIENLYLISGGAMPPNPSELLLKPAMGALLNDLKNRFDYIILDTPPLGLVTDAFVLAPLVNHILFVVRQDYTPRQVLQALEEYYSKGKLTNISILFNDLRKTGLGYGYGNYGYSYGYGYRYGYGYGGLKKKSDGDGYYA